MQYPLEKYRTYWQDTIYQKIYAAHGGEKLRETLKSPRQLPLALPPEGQGEIAIALFRLGKALKMNPSEIARSLSARIPSEHRPEWGTVTHQGGYLNVHLPRAACTTEVLRSVAGCGDHYGRNTLLKEKRVAIEFSSPNTNKPLHLGHLRNNALGASLANIVEACGAEVRKINLVNDRGIHICKSMAAYLKYGRGATPLSSGKKSDHFVGDWYVRYTQWEKEEPHAIEKARELLRRWERGDREVMTTWNTMNGWAESGMAETYRITGVTFDEVDHESETYLRGREEILRHRDAGVLARAEDGSVWIDLTDSGLDKKALLRADGTSLYVTQDIGTILGRYERWRFDQHIYVVASEQRYHFKVLFEILRRMGHQWATRLLHRSYGMVFLPEGKMKSREGTVVDADDLIDSLQTTLVNEIVRRTREPESTQESATKQITDSALKIAVAALHYWLLKREPHKDVSFDIHKSISFTGDSGAYILYVYARLASIRREAVRQGIPAPQLTTINGELLSHPTEWGLVTAIAEFPLILQRAAEALDPSLLCGYLYRMCKLFSQYYHELPIIRKERIEQSQARLALCEALGYTLQHGCRVLLMPVVERM